jgi:hypothetical protein
MLVKSREEPESVLAREVLAAPSCGVRHREAARLASEHDLLLVNADDVSALREFMGGAQACDSSAEYRYTFGHGVRLPPEKRDKRAF